MFGSASDTERDILSCASLTRALRSASEDMAWMVRVLHCFVWSREGPWIIAASQPVPPGVYPYLASSTEFLMFTQRGLAGSVLIGRGRLVCISGFSRRVIWQQSPGCSTDAVERDWFFTRPSFDISAHHTRSRCSHNELLKSSLMPKKTSSKNLSVI